MIRVKGKLSSIVVRRARGFFWKTVAQARHAGVEKQCTDLVGGSLEAPARCCAVVWTGEMVSAWKSEVVCSSVL